MLTHDEIHYLLDLIAKTLPNNRIGYSDDPEVARIQGKLSIMLEATSHQPPNLWIKKETV